MGSINRSLGIDDWFAHFTREKGEISQSKSFLFNLVHVRGLPKRNSTRKVLEIEGKARLFKLLSAVEQGVEIGELWRTN